MPMPYVISATINQENKIVLTVKIDDEFTTGETSKYLVMLHRMVAPSPFSM